MRKKPTSLPAFFEAPLFVRAEEPETGGLPKTMTFVIATEKVALDDGVVLMSGANVETYVKRPLVLMNHNYSQPIGKSKIVVDQKSKTITATVELAPENVLSEESKRILNYMAWAKFGAASIGFKVDDADRSPTKEEKEFYGLGDFGWIARKWTLLEWSIVLIPADPGSFLIEQTANKGSLALCRAAAAVMARSYQSSKGKRMDGEKTEDELKKEEMAKAAEETAPDAPTEGDEGTEDDGAMSMAIEAMNEKIDMLIEGMNKLSEAIMATVEQKAMDEESDMEEETSDDEDAMTDEERNIADALRELSSASNKTLLALAGGSAKS